MRSQRLALPSGLEEVASPFRQVCENKSGLRPFQTPKGGAQNNAWEPVRNGGATSSSPKGEAH